MASDRTFLGRRVAVDDGSGTLRKIVQLQKKSLVLVCQQLILDGVLVPFKNSSKTYIMQVIEKMQSNAVDEKSENNETEKSENTRNSTASEETEKAENSITSEQKQKSENSTANEKTKMRENTSASEVIETEENSTTSEAIENVENSTTNKEIEEAENSVTSEKSEKSENGTAKEKTEIEENISTSEAIETVENSTRSEAIENVENSTASEVIEEAENSITSEKSQKSENRTAKENTEIEENISTSEAIETVENSTTSEVIENVEKNTTSKRTEKVENSTTNEEIEEAENSIVSEKSKKSKNSIANEKTEMKENISTSEVIENIENNTTASEEPEKLENRIAIKNSQHVVNITITEKTEMGENTSISEIIVNVENSTTSEKTVKIKNSTTKKETEKSESNTAIVKAQNSGDSRSSELTKKAKNSITSEKTERTKSRTVKTSEFKDFSKELTNFPHIIRYLKKLERKIQRERTYVIKLEKKLSNIERQSPQKEFVEKESQTDFDASKNESKDWTNSEDNNKSIAQQVTEAAQSAMLQTGFVYDQTTGLYYDYNSGYYYDSQSGLYYNGHTGTYYTYDEQSKSYNFHSQVYNKTAKPAKTSSSTKRRRTKRKEKKGRVKKAKTTEYGDNESESEEGLCTETDEEDSSSCEDSVSSPNNSDRDEDNAKAYPPCMRIIVKETKEPKLKVGYLFMVTYTGGSIGREGDHAVIIPDINISKHHAKLQYNEEVKSYEIIDLGSRNGTFLNNKRISAAKQESEPTKIVHGSILQLGSTKLLCHIHKGLETCGHCEPGLLQSEAVIEVVPKKTYQSELKRLKNKFGLEENNINEASSVAPGYQDRARSRRHNIGSSHEYSKTEQSSLSESISRSNVGFKMLSKMGWSEGMALGKTGEGVKEPVALVRNINKAGLGASEDQIHSVEIDPSTEKKQSMWKKAQQRFNDIAK